MVSAKNMRINAKELHANSGAVLYHYCCFRRRPASGKKISWMDEPKPASWNKSGLSIPAAPRSQADVDPRCRNMARPPQFEEDKRLKDQGWDLGFDSYFLQQVIP